MAFLCATACIISYLRFMFEYSDEYFMRAALQEAQKGFNEDEVPVGAVVVLNSKIIARGHNEVEKLNDPTAHAEMIALTSAFNYLGSKYLPEATLFVTIEPCLMCCGALYWSKIGRIVYGANDEKNGGLRFFSLRNGTWPFHPKTELTKGLLREECAQLLKNFFKAKR